MVNTYMLIRQYTDPYITIYHSYNDPQYRINTHHTLPITHCTDSEVSRL